jgi:hypothetical protein
MHEDGVYRIHMGAILFKKVPKRRPQWRADRVMVLADNPRLRPRSTDDHYIREYRRYRRLESPGRSDTDTTDKFFTFIKFRQTILAEQIYFGPYDELRLVLDARLLTQETFAEIANRLQIEEDLIDHYEALFFNVRGRLHDTDWIQEVILGQPEFRPPEIRGRIGDGQRGFLYRLFGYYAGPNLLDVVIQQIGPTTIPGHDSDTFAWSHYAADQIVQCWIVVDPGSLELNRRHVVHLLELAADPQPMAKPSRGRRRRPPTDFEILRTTLLEKLSERSSAQLLGSPDNERRGMQDVLHGT